MHKVAIPPEIVAQAQAMRGGKEHIFSELNPARTAHVIVDMQNGYLAPGAVLEVPPAREIVPAINALSRAMRKAGGLNVFLQYAMRDEAESSWSTWHGLHNSPASHAATRTAFEPGAEQWKLWSELHIEEPDLIVEKQRFSAFIPGTCNLDRELRQRNIDTIVITGTMTNVCCESTARDAMQMNYKVIFASNATATWTDAAHNAALANMCMIFADVMDTGEIVNLLESAATPL